MPGSALPPVLVELRASIGEFKAKMGEAAGEVKKTAAEIKAEAAKVEAEVDKIIAKEAEAAKKAGSEFDASARKAQLMAEKQTQSTSKSGHAFKSLATVGKGALLGIAGAAVAVGGESIKMAGDFEEGVTSLVTGAGESQKNIKQVADGILNLAPQVGTSTQQLTQGMYMIESAGYHGAAGLNVLKAAAQGAKVGSADLQTVADGVTTVLTDYHLPASQAAAVTSQLVETVASGKTHMQDLAGSLSTVLPIASSMHISFQDVAGALATMTGQGISAQNASQDLANTIRNLGNPLPAATKMMDQFGISSVDVQQHLGQRGLYGTLAMLTEQITKKMGPSGLVLLNSFKQSKTAAADAAQELSKLPPSLQSMAKAYQAGTVTQSAFRKELKALPVDQRQLIQQFSKTVDASRGFNDQLRSGTPAAKTLSGALSSVLGGATGLNTALALTGPNMATYGSNLANIQNAAKTGAKQVQGWDEVQKDFNFKLEQAKGSAEKLGIQLGEKLIPIVEQAAEVGQQAVSWLERHKAVALALAGVIGGVLAAAMGAWVVLTGVKLVKSVREAAKVIGKLGEAIVDNAGKFVKLGASVAQFVARQAVQLAAGIRDVAVWAAEHAVAAASFIAENVAMAASATAAFIAENAATLGIIAGLALLVAGIIWVATHWSEVWGFVKSIALDVYHFLDGIWHDIDKTARGAWGAIEGFFKQIWNDIVHTAKTVWDDLMGFFKRWWPELLAVITGPIGLIVGLIVQHWSQITQFTQNLWHDVTGFFTRMWTDVTGAVNTGVSDVVNWFEQLPGRVLGAIEGLGQALYNFGSHIIQMLINGVENMAGNLASAVGGVVKGALSHLPGGSLVTGALGDLGIHLAEGGFVNKPTFALVGEAGPELVLPLSDPQRMTQLLAPLMSGTAPANPTAAAFAAAAGAPTPGKPAATTPTVGTAPQVSVYAQTNADPAQIGSEVGWALRQYMATT